jgi:hypothetical protein
MRTTFTTSHEREATSGLHLARQEVTRERVDVMFSLRMLMMLLLLRFVRGDTTAVDESVRTREEMSEMSSVRQQAVFDRRSTYGSSGNHTLTSFFIPPGRPFLFKPTPVGRNMTKKSKNPMIVRQ